MSDTREKLEQLGVNNPSPGTVWALEQLAAACALLAVYRKHGPSRELNERIDSFLSGIEQQGSVGEATAAQAAAEAPDGWQEEGP